MGEIKSTLEIIMEKTKGLTMSDEEKKAFQRKEAEGKVRGLLQRFLDGGLDLSGLEKEFAVIGQKQRELAREVLLAECLIRLDPQGENAPLLDVLQHLAHVDVQPLADTVSGFRQDLERQKVIQERDFRERLAEGGISGTAVIPNINADPDWARYLSQMNEGFQEMLASIKGKLVE